jgi:hypothetical protein
MMPLLFHIIPGVAGSVVGNEAKNAVIVTGLPDPVGIGDGGIAVVGVIEITPPSFQAVPGVVGSTVGNEVINVVKSAGDIVSVCVGAVIGTSDPVNVGADVGGIGVVSV